MIEEDIPCLILTHLFDANDVVWALSGGTFFSSSARIVASSMGSWSGMV